MIYLVRHGQTDWNLEKKIQGHIDVPLNNNGKRQAELVSEAIKDLKINKIYSSDLVRAKETAAIINKKLNLKITLDNRLREFNYGDLEGVVKTTFSEDIWDEFNSNPERIHAESSESVYNRIKEFFDELNINDNILIVTHGGALRVIMYYFNNKDKFDKDLFNKEYCNMIIENGAIYEVDMSNRFINIIDI